MTVVFSARQIITMDASRPRAEAVAVRDGCILAVGALDELRAIQGARVDDRFRDAVLVPGLIEGHSHVYEGAFWRGVYVGYHDRRDDEGRLWPGLKSIEAVVERLREAEKALPPGEKALFGWGFDPIYFEGRRMERQDLDMVSAQRPVCVMHASLHIINVNSLLLERAKITAATNVQGVLKDAGGQPNGELQGPSLRYMVLRSVADDFMRIDADALWRFGRIAARAGVTTATDLHSELTPDIVGAWLAATGHEDFPVRVVPALGALMHGKEKSATMLADLRQKSTDKLHFGLAKMVLDGSIQGFTARLKWPGYHNGAPNGLWYFSPPEVPEFVLALHKAGATLHIHTNGDEATELALDAIDYAQSRYYRADHRTTLQHCQMASPAQFRRMKALGVCVNLFANHIWYWGEQHRAITMGPDRAERLDACGSALREGLTLAIHSDAPITPIDPLFTAWCAVNRITMAGRILGPGERITAEQALRAITLGAAQTLGLDHEIGSIEVGKRADFAALGASPLDVPPETLKDIPVRGTILSGRAFEVRA